jgi:hypothetical protein
MTMRRFALLTTAATLPFAFDTGAAAPAAATDNKPAKPRVEPLLTEAFAGVEMPVKPNKRGSASIFPFETLTAVGMAFGIKNRNAKSLSSIISNANRKAMVNKTDDAGNVVYKTTEMKDANGTVVGRSPTTEPEKVDGVKYEAFDVDADLKKKIKGTPLEGSTVLVFRKA